MLRFPFVNYHGVGRWRSSRLRCQQDLSSCRAADSDASRRFYPRQDVLTALHMQARGVAKRSESCSRIRSTSGTMAWRRMLQHPSSPLRRIPVYPRLAQQLKGHHANEKIGMADPCWCTYAAEDCLAIAPLGFRTGPSLLRSKSKKPTRSQHCAGTPTAWRRERRRKQRRGSSASQRLTR